MTIHDIILRAMRLIGVVAADDDMTADQAANGFASFGDMIAEWQLIGFPQPAVEPVTINDEFTYPREYANAAVHLLAAQIAPEYDRPLSFDPMQYKRLIERANMVVPTTAVPNALLFLPSQRKLRTFYQ